MKLTEKLYLLQEMDLALSRYQSTLTWIEEQLNRRPLDEIKEKVQALGQRIRDLRVRQWEAELQTEEWRAKIQEVEKKLYSGLITNPRELMSMEEEVKHLKKLVKDWEDMVLEVMIELDERQREFGEVDRQCRSLEAQWQEEQRKMAEERERLSLELESLLKQREELAATVDPQYLSLYEALRNAKKGLAIAKVERGMCQGCHITLPSYDLHRARGPQELVRCSSCGRILYVQ